MTADEQKSHDEIIAKACEVAMKAHRHDREVWQFARDLSAEVGIPGMGGELSSSALGSKSRRLSFKGMGAQVAAKMLPDGVKALAPSGAAVVG